MNATQVMGADLIDTRGSAADCRDACTHLTVRRVRMQTARKL